MNSKLEITKDNLLREMNNLSVKVSDVAKKFGLNKNNIYDRLKEFNIPKRGRGSKQIYIANDEAFSKWSSKMAYCLGFIAADGHIWKDLPYITIGISRNDYVVLEYIRDYISPNSKIRRSNEGIQMCVRSKKIWEDLNKFGIDHNKTFNLKISFDIPKEYVGDFVRGYFDGDGSIWKTNKVRACYAGSIVSASKQVLLDIQSLIGFGVLRETHKGKYFALEFGQSNLLKLKAIIYRDPKNVIMHRKYDKFLKIDPINKPWGTEEDELLLKNLYKKIREIHSLFQNRSKEAIQARKNFLRKKHGKDKKHYASW